MPIAEPFNSFYLFPRNVSCPANWIKSAEWGDTTLDNLLSILWLQHSVRVTGDITVRYTDNAASSDPGAYSEYRLYGDTTHLIGPRAPADRICQPFAGFSSPTETWHRIENRYNADGGITYAGRVIGEACEFISTVAPYKGSIADRYRFNCQLRIGPFSIVHELLDVVTMTAAEYATATHPLGGDYIIHETTISVLGISVPVVVTARYSTDFVSASLQSFSLSVTSAERWTFPEA